MNWQFSDEEIATIYSHMKKCAKDSSIVTGYRIITISRGEKDRIRGSYLFCPTSLNTLLL